MERVTWGRTTRDITLPVSRIGRIGMLSQPGRKHKKKKAERFFGLYKWLDTAGVCGFYIAIGKGV